MGADVAREIEQLVRGRRTNNIGPPWATSLLGFWQMAQLLDRIPILRGVAGSRTPTHTLARPLLAPFLVGYAEIVVRHAKLEIATRAELV
jgi:hypothetical protein